MRKTRYIIADYSCPMCGLCFEKTPLNELVEVIVFHNSEQHKADQIALTLISKFSHLWVGEI